MRTTIDLPDETWSRAKAVAALQGKTLKDFVILALQRQLDAEDQANVRPRLELPLVPSTRPGSVNLTNDDIARLLDVSEAPA